MTRSATLAVLLLFVLSCFTLAADQKTVTPLAKAHAHNDYWHKRPLLDALAEGFCSVEADVFLVDGQILVGHDKNELTPERTLETLYLKPLQKRVRENGGRVFKNGPVFWLWIDQKTDAEPTYRALHALLEKYVDMITSVENGKLTERAVRVVISGNRPIELMKNQDAKEPRLAGIDGRLSDLDSQSPNSTFPAHLMPFISDNWRNTFKWNAIGPMPEKEREKLEQIAHKTHAAGRRLRFWATPESETAWSVFLDTKVDRINTDQLDRLRHFLEQGEQ